MSKWDIVWYGALMLAGIAATQTAIEIGAGNVPFPVEWRWLLPIIQAVLVGLASLLPSARKRE